MKVFWREKPLSDDEVQLVNAVGDAHARSAFRQNPSTVAVACAAQGSGDLCRSLAAGLMAFGGSHGPVEETYLILTGALVARKIVWDLLAENRKVPGWGTSFSQDGIDELWQPVNALLWEKFPEIAKKIQAFTDALHSEGVMIYPNPSAFTAAAALALQMPERLAPYLLVMGRLASWCEIYMNETKGK